MTRVLARARDSDVAKQSIQLIIHNGLKVLDPPSIQSGEPKASFISSRLKAHYSSHWSVGSVTQTQLACVEAQQCLSCSVQGLNGQWTPILAL